MHRAGRVGRYKDSGTVFVVYRNGIDENINRLTRKGINFHYYLINNEKMTEKPLRLHLKHKKMFDTSTNEKIKRIIYSNSKKVKPGYKKKIKMQINKIKQKVRHEYIEKQIKKQLIHKNIQDSKAKKH
jgi:ATP-dependent RNA helicase CshB